MKSQVLHTVWCNICNEAAGEIWHWSLLGAKGLKWLTSGPRETARSLGRVSTRPRAAITLPQLSSGRSAQTAHGYDCGSNWPLPKRVGAWFVISTAKALGIVGRKMTSKKAASLQLWPFVQPGYAAVIVMRYFLLDLARILSLQSIPRALAVLIRTQLLARFGNG